jgi:hypothetical protein
MAQCTGFHGRHASRFRRDRTTGHPAGIAPRCHDGGCRVRIGPARGRTESRGSTEASRWDRTSVAMRESALVSSRGENYHRTPKRRCGTSSACRVTHLDQRSANARLNTSDYSASLGIRGNCFLSPPLPWNHGWTRLQYTPIVGLNADGSSRLCRCGCSPRCRRCAPTLRASSLSASPHVQRLFY